MDVLLHAAHLIAAAFWVGGMLFTGLVLGPVLRRDVPPATRLPLVRTVGRRFSIAGWTALGVLLLTGLHRLRFLFHASPAFLTETRYGRLLLFKFSLFVLMAVLSAVHDGLLGPAVLREGADPASPAFRSAARRLAFWARVNVLLVLGIVALAAALRHTGL